MTKYDFLNKSPLKQKISPYIKWILIFALAIILVFVARSYANSLYQKELKKFEPENQAMQDGFRISVEKSSLSSYELTLLGKKMLETNRPQWAIIILDEASKKDSQYRDAALFAGYANLKFANDIKNNPTTYQLQAISYYLPATSYLEKAIEYLNRAKDIDPIYDQTYELLTVAYQNLGDDKNAALCYNKFKEFSKN
jgi:tetratricopeptide (TPR) repeat protein